MICVIASSAAIGYVLYLLNAAWGFGSNEIPAHDLMMKMLVEGIMNAELPWALILIGIFVAIVVEILGIPVLPFAVGMYLPFSLSAGIMAGGVVRWILERRKTDDEKKRKLLLNVNIIYFRSDCRRGTHGSYPCNPCSIES